MNHIDNIEIKNFKSIRHARLEGCKRINVLVGPPNVGKSNVLEALAITNGKSQLNELTRFEKLAHLFYLGDIKQNITIQYHDNFFCEFVYESANRLLENVKYSLKDIEVTDYTDSKIWDSDGGWMVGQVKERDTAKEKRIVDFRKNNVLIKPYRFSDKGFTQSVSVNELLSPYGRNLFEVLRYDSGPRKYAGELLELHGLKLVFDENDKLRVQKELDEFTVFQLPFAQIADTLQRLIFHITAILVNSNSVLLFEEPEAHCYEPYIMELTNVIKNDRNNNQFFIVTHNQFVISELLRDEAVRNETNVFLANMVQNETKIKLVKREVSEDVYERQLDVFFNFDSLWQEN